MNTNRFEKIKKYTCSKKIRTQLLFPDQKAFRCLFEPFIANDDERIRNYRIIRKT